MRLILFLALGLMGCASPSMMGATRLDTSVGNSRFHVYYAPGNDAVEIHRVSFEPLPSFVMTAAKAIRAVQQATGCTIRDGTLKGDPAIMTAEVDC